MVAASPEMPLEFSAVANGRRICGLRWQNNPEALPTLALHGWLDNAASFSLLAKQLAPLDLWAIDLPGHGLSEHRPPPGSYNLWDDLLDILALADELGWQQFNLLGHSRGALISTLLAATMPERIARVVLLDAVWPMPVQAEQAPALLRKYLHDQRSYTDKKLPRYPSFAAAVKARQKTTGLSAAAASLIVERGVDVAADGSVSWCSDPRLTLGSAFKLSEQQNRAFLAAVAAPTLILLAEDGYARVEGIEQQLQQFQGISYRVLPGSHDFHLQDPSLVAPPVAVFLGALHSDAL